MKRKRPSKASDNRAKKKVRKLDKEGREAINAGDYVLAERKYTEAIALDPTNTKIRLIRGDTLEKLGRLDDALREYDRLLEMFPDCESAWTYKATLLNNRDLFAEAELCADNALKLNINNSSAWGQKGFALELQHKIEEAMRCYEQQILMSPAEGWARKGALLVFEYCDYENAIVCFDKALELDRQNGIAWNGKGTAYYSLGEYEEAAKCYDNVLTAYPDSPNVWNNKGITLLFQGKFEEAEKCFQTAFNYPWDPSFPATFNNMGYFYLHQGKFEEALKLFEKALIVEKEKDFATQGKVLCEYLMTNPRPPSCPNPTGKSVPKFNKLNQIELYFYRGKTLLIFGELEEAKKAFEKCLEWNPNYKAAAIEIDKIKELRKEKEAPEPSAQLQNSAPAQ